MSQEPITPHQEIEEPQITVRIEADNIRTVKDLVLLMRLFNFNINILPDRLDEEGHQVLNLALKKGIIKMLE